MSSNAIGKPGRASLGERKPQTVRLPTAQFDRYDSIAKAMGISTGSYFVLMLSKAHGEEAPDYVLDEISAAARLREQEELPMEPLARSA